MPHRNKRVVFSYLMACCLVPMIAFSTALSSASFAQVQSFSCPTRYAIFRFEEAPYYMLLNVDLGPFCSKVISGKVRGFFNDEALFSVRGEISGGLLRLTFSARSTEFDISYSYAEPLPRDRESSEDSGWTPEIFELPGSNLDSELFRLLKERFSLLVPGARPRARGMWFANRLLPVELRQFANFRVVTQYASAERTLIYWSERPQIGKELQASFDEIFGRDRDAPQPSAPRRDKDWTCQPVLASITCITRKVEYAKVEIAEALNSLFHGDVIVGVQFENFNTGLPPVTLDKYAVAPQCEHKQSELDDALKKVKGWNVEVEPRSGNAFLVVIKSHTHDYPFYQPNFWWKASIQVSYSGAPSCEVSSFSLFDTVVCPGPHDKDNPFQPPFRDCFYRVPVGSNAESQLSEVLQGVLVKLQKKT